MDAAKISCLIKSAYKEGYADATDVDRASEYWWESSTAKSRLDHELKQLKDTK